MAERNAWTIANGDQWSLRDDPGEASPVLVLGSVGVALTKEQADLIAGRQEPAHEPGMA